MDRDTHRARRLAVRRELVAAGGQRDLMLHAVRVAMARAEVTVETHISGIVWRLNLLGKRSSSTSSANQAMLNWAEAVLRAPPR